MTWRRTGFFTSIAPRFGGEEVVGLAVTSAGVVGVAEVGGITDGLG